MRRGIFRIIICTRVKKICKYIFWYLVIVFVSAVVNWVVFNRNTTSFLISEQTNKHVIRYDLLSDELNLAEFHANARDLMPVSVDGLVGFVSSKLMRLSEVNDSLLVYRQQIESLQRELDSLSMVAGAHRDSIADAYLKTAMYPYKHQLDSIDQIMSGMDSTEMILQGFLIEKTRLKLKYAVKNREVLDYIFRNFQSLIPSDERDKHIDNSSKIVSYMAEKSSLEQEQHELVRSLRESVAQFHGNRRSSVGFRDFLYYSICVSTTVSFGDIAPNNGLTRFIAILELLSCIVLVSFILNGLIKNKNE